MIAVGIHINVKKKVTSIYKFYVVKPVITLAFSSTKETDIEVEWNTARNFAMKLKAMYVLLYDIS